MDQINKLLDQASEKLGVERKYVDYAVGGAAIASEWFIELVTLMGPGWSILAPPPNSA